MAELHPSSEAVLLSQEGLELQSLRLDPHQRRLDWTSLDQVNPELIQVLQAVEDQRFLQHDGIDWQAFLGNLTHLHMTRGTSTLSMQVAAELDTNLGMGGQRSLWQKFCQMRAAWQLELHWSKAQILEAYLNLCFGRGEFQGIEATTQAILRKSPQSLDLGEIYFLVALLGNPDAPLDKALQRTCKLYQKLQKAPCTFISTLQNNLQRLRLSSAGLAPHAARLLLHQGGQSFKSTLSQPLQIFASQALQRRLRELIGQRVEDGALIVLDNRTGSVLAYVASSGPLSQSQFVDGIQAQRQAGSTLKPFLYQMALEQGMSPADLIEDSPLNLSTDLGIYAPQNYDHRFQGWVSLRRALASSMNIPTLKILDAVGLSAFYERLQNLGFQLPSDADFYGPTLALGSAEVSLWNLSQAYLCLARRGHCLKANFDGNSKPSFQLDSISSFLIAHILSDPSARAWGFGLDNVFNTPYWSAAKTGTSKGMRDNWCLGWSQHYTVGVWVGNFSGAEMGNVSGLSGAAPLWLDLMNFLHSHLQSLPPNPPSGLQHLAVQFAKGQESPRKEYLRPGQKSGLISPPPSLNQEYLLSPSDGEVIALDPEIPAPNQRLLIRRRANANLHLWIDGQDHGSDPKLLWFPRPGHHRIQVVDSQMRVLDSAKIWVKALRAHS